MKIYLIRTALALLLSGTIVSCGNNDLSKEEKTKKSVAGKDEAELEEGHEDHDEQNPDQAELSAEQMKTIGVELGTIEQKQLTGALKTNGVLRVPNQNKASVNTLYSGVIKSLLVQPGNYVRKSQTIATLANPEFIQVQSDLLNINSKITLAELELKRQKELNEGNAGALKNLQSAESTLRTLQNSRSTLSQQIRLMGINPAKLSSGKLISVLNITSPISGVVSNVNVKMGSYVDLTTTVAEIVDNSQLHLDLFVYEKDLAKLKNNQTIHFTITNNPGKEYDAKIFSLGSSFEGESKAVTVHAMVEGNKTGLIDGMNVTGVVSLRQVTVPAVPSDAIVTVAGQDYIFVLEETLKTAGFIFKRVPVVKGGSDIGFTEITPVKEVLPSAKIVTKGAFFISAKMTNTEGHH